MKKNTQGRVRHSEDSAINPLTHTKAHRHSQLARIVGNDSIEKSRTSLPSGVPLRLEGMYNLSGFVLWTMEQKHFCFMCGMR